MHFSELIYVILMVVLLVGMAGYVGWRQWQTLRRLPQQSLSRDEYRYYRTLALRRLVGSVLMVVLAGLLVGSYWLGQERQAQEMSQRNQGEGEPTDAPLNEAEKQFLTQYSTFWIVFGLVLLSLVALAFMDFWTIHRFARRHIRQLQADRRAMIAREVAEYRRQRNGR
jgi:hypothetical protein